VAQLEAQKNMSADTTPLGPFAGMNNRLPDHQLGLVERGRKAGDYLRNAVNVDLTATGTLQRRKGTTLALAGADCHSLWADEQGAYFVDGGDLKTFPAGEVVRSGLTPGRAVSYCRLPDGRCAWSNGVELGFINGGVSSPPLSPPNPAPVVTASNGGALHAGVYQVAITAADAEGRESGATWPVQVTVPDGGRIEISGLPGDPAAATNIYLSPLNGDVLYHATTTIASSYSFPLVPQTLGRQLDTVGLVPMPPGRIVRYYHGRLLTADSAQLCYSEPFAHWLYHPMRNRILIAGLTLVEPVEGGLYLATQDKTWWLPGADVDQPERLVEILPYGAAAHSAARVENGTGVVWLSTRGLVIGDTQGQLRNAQEDVAAVGAAQTGATLYREQNGLRQIVATLSGPDTTSAAASTYFEAELVRKENML